MINKTIDTKPTESARNSNFEALRIVSMLLIVAHHFAVHSNFDLNAPLGFNTALLQLLILGGKVGVNCFVLTSGYFLVTDRKLSLCKIAKLWFKALLYSVVIFALFCLTGQCDFSLDKLVDAFTPLLTNQWWFLTAYALLFLLHPFVNAALRNLSKRSYLALLCVFFALFCLLPTVMNYTDNSTPVNWLWFLILYAVGGYVKLHGLPTKLKCLHWSLLAIGAYALTYVISIVTVALGYGVFYLQMYDIRMFAVSALMFAAVATAAPRSSRAVNLIASATFGVYLLHDNMQYVRYWLWQTLLAGRNFQYSSWLIVYALGSVAGVYALCTIIDLLYELSVGTLLKKAENTTWGRKINNIFTINIG